MTTTAPVIDEYTCTVTKTYGDLWHVEYTTSNAEMPRHISVSLAAWQNKRTGHFDIGWSACATPLGGFELPDGWQLPFLKAPLATFTQEFKRS